MNSLFTPCRVGAVALPNRMVMAPMMRGRAGPMRVPNALMVEYYSQRATAGLIVTEGVQISDQAAGWVDSAAISTPEDVAGWRLVTDAVHKAGGRIFLQLWHCGRASHPEFQPNGQLPVSASAVAIPGDIHVPSGKKPHVAPRALDIGEIPGVVQQYADAAKRSRDAGFDGVEIHGANGYLIDQFLRDGSNKRTDAYGGSIANRARFLLEVTAAVAGAWSADRVGVRLSPVGSYNDMRDSDPISTFGYAAEALSAFGLAYLHNLEALLGHPFATPGPRVGPAMRKAFQGPFVVNGGYDATLGAEAIDAGEADLVAFGVPFLANPDLVERDRTGAALNAPDPKTFYTPGPKGYTDYPTLASK